MQRESMQFDVVVVGAGVAGLSTAIKLKQLALQDNQDLSICVVEKGSEVGAHILSGAVLDPIALNELIPNWQQKGAPVTCRVTKDKVLMLTKTRSFPLPTPPSMHNEGNFIISLSQLTRWLATQAEELGIDIYPGFAASEVLYHEDGSVKGIATGDMGVGKNGEQTANYQIGMELHARQTVFAEGCRGSLSGQIIKQFNLDKNCQPQTYGLGVKEIWEVDPSVSSPGMVMHSLGWPLDFKTYGGSFIYHMEDCKIAVGFVVGLDYQNPYFSPFEEFQRFKTHPAIRHYFANGKRIEYGARVISEGGIQSLPKVSFAGGVLVGDSAGFLNMPRIKGIHTAIKSGMLAAESVYQALLTHPLSENHNFEAVSFEENVNKSWLYRELFRARNIRPAFKWGFFVGTINAALEEYVFRGKGWWTIKHHGADNLSLIPAQKAQLIDYPKPDGVLTFDRLSSIYLSGVHHEENQPSHLQVDDEKAMISVNYKIYDSPETRYCPAGVYEIIKEENGEVKLQINASNCIHCKTCDIKDPEQNIHWVCPEGGGGPNYSNM
ncbi:electron transfer flavoprotein-ubiquinone oxidoreductase [Neisseria sp. Ec49-e6-T10]